MKFTGEYTKEISFPLGGIGSGSIGLDGSGRLVDWEIFNRPAKGSRNGYTHFAVKAISDDGIVTRVLAGDTCESYMGQYRNSNTHTAYGFGPDKESLCGFPHFKTVDFNGEFPIATLDFKDGTMIFPETEITEKLEIV